MSYIKPKKFLNAIESTRESSCQLLAAIESVSRCMLFGNLSLSLFSWSLVQSKEVVEAVAQSVETDTNFGISSESIEAAKARPDARRLKS